MPKVVLISGSPNVSGNTAQLIQKCAQAIESNDVQTEIISFAGKSIGSCVACGACAKTGKCAQNDGLNEIIDTIRGAQGLIIGAPVYYGTARGDVMSALQRIGFVSGKTDRFLAGMVGGPIAVARRGGQTSALQEMLMFYLMNDMIVPGSSYWNMAFGRMPGEAMNDEEGVRTICHFGENVAKVVKAMNR